MGYLSWLFGGEPLEERAAAPAPTYPTPPARTSTSRGAVGAGEALTISTVYRAVQIHAIAAKQIGIGAWRNGATLANTPAILAQPNLGCTRSAFIEQTVVSLASAGNCYWLKTLTGTGAVANLEVLNPLDVVIESDDSGKPIAYRDGDIRYGLERIQHLSLLRVPGSAKGLGPIQAAQIELRGAIDLRDYSSNWFEDGDIPTGILKSDAHLTAEAAALAKAQWAESQGARAGVAVLGAGLDYKPIFLSPADAQFLESQKFTVSQVARLFGVPASLMLAAVEGSSMTYANVEQDWLGYVRFSLMSYLVEIEDAFSAILPRGTEARFNVEALLRTDTTTRYSAHKLALDGGWMTIDEIRAIENLGAMPTTGGPA